MSNLIPVDSLTLEELADLLSELLERRGYDVQKNACLQLQVGTEVIDWKYPSIVIGNKAGDAHVFVVRFGASAAIPGYLAKYLDGARRNHGIPLYVVCPETLLNDYRGLCDMYGLGLVGCSLSSHSLQFVSSPSDVDIRNAYDRQVDVILQRAQEAAADALREIERSSKRFRAEAKRRGLEERRSEFEARRSRVTARLTEIESRGAEAKRSRSMDELRELETLIDEGDFG